MAIKQDILASVPVGWRGTTRSLAAAVLDFSERIGDKNYEKRIKTCSLKRFIQQNISSNLTCTKQGIVKEGYFVAVPNTHPQEWVRTTPSTPLIDRKDYQPIGGKRTKAPKKHQDRIANLNAKYGEELRQSYPHCACCGIHLPHIHYAQVDHLVSIAKEGKEIIEGNLCMMCVPCNLVKQTKTIETARIEIKNKGVKIDLGLAMNAERVHTSIDLKIPADYLK